MEQPELLNYLIDTLERLRIRYGITGSHASTIFGEPRFTMDIDVLVDLTPMNLEIFCNAFPYPKFYVSEDGARYAAVHGGMFNILVAESGQKIDVVVPGSEEGKGVFGRVVRAGAIDQRIANFISPEDLIISKLRFYQEGGSDKHLRDIGGILKMTPTVDRERVAASAEQLGLLAVWQLILKKV